MKKTFVSLMLSVACLGCKTVHDITLVEKVEARQNASSYVEVVTRLPLENPNKMYKDLSPEIKSLIGKDIARISKTRASRLCLVAMEDSGYQDNCLYRPISNLVKPNNRDDYKFLEIVKDCDEMSALVEEHGKLTSLGLLVDGKYFIEFCGNYIRRAKEEDICE